LKELIFSIINGLNKNSLDKKNKDFIYNLKDKSLIHLKGDNYFFNDDVICGELDVSISKKGFLKPYTKNETDYMILKKDLKSYKQNDIILAIKGKRFRGRDTVKPVLRLSSANNIIMAYTKKIGKKIFLLELKTKDIITLSLSQKSLKELPNLTILQINKEESKILKVVGVLSDPMVDEQICLSMFDRKEGFSYKSKLELKSFGDEVDGSLYSHRKDLRNIDFVTIDPVDAKDHDDAIYYDKKNNKIIVAIADVSEYVVEFSNLDKEALERGFSIYFPHKSIPMLPRLLSENLCSLKLNSDRLAFICEISLDNQGSVLKEQFYEAIINVKRNYNYDETEYFLNDFSEKINQDIIKKSLKDLFLLTNKIRKQRLEKGSDFQSDEVKISLDKNGQISKTITSKSISSHHLVEECMLLANKASAKILGEEGIFRVHPPANMSKVHDVVNWILPLGINADIDKDINQTIKNIQSQTPKHLRSFIDVLLIKSQSKAFYQKRTGEHFALGFDCYTHFTSPIRRYADLLVHRLIKSIIQNSKKNSYLLKSMDYKCEKINENEEKVSKIEFDFRDRKYARWAEEWTKKNKNKYIMAIVVDLKKDPLVIVDDEIYGLRVFLKSYNNDIQLFQKIKIQITNTDIISTRVSGVQVE
jgi:ribonuclease R